MKDKLRLSQNVLIGSLLFGLFFGAGNLIFPVKMGQMSGSNVWLSSLGFLITGVGLPILGVVGSVLSKSSSMLEMNSPMGKVYATIFTCLLYLTIGPLFAIPRTATVAFEVGTRPFVNEEVLKVALFIFSFIFFALTLFFSLKPARIIDWVGRYLTPIFLVLLSILIILSIANPMGNVADIAVQGAYIDKPLITGVLDGYNTMDALASLAFAIIIIINVNKLNINEPKAVAKEVLKSGVVCLIFMSVIYVALAYMGASSLGSMAEAENGGLILSMVSNHYLGIGGQILLAGIVTVACLKTAIGLITACSEMFSSMFPNSLSYKGYAILFTAFSFVIANFGLSNIISYSVPMLMFLYPMAIVLIILSMLAPVIKKNSIIYGFTMGFTTVSAIFDLLKNLPSPIKDSAFIVSSTEFAKAYLPFFDYGFGWAVPAAIGFIIGLIVNSIIRQKEA